MNARLLIILLAMASIGSVRGALQITSIGSPQTIDFNGFTGTGFTNSPAAGQLDSDDWAVTGFSDGNLAFGEMITSGDYARGESDGSVSTGGIYAFDVGGGNVALGVQPGGSDFTPGTFTLRLENATGSLLSGLNVSYAVYVLNDQGRANSFNFSYSVDNSAYSSISALDYISPEVADTTPQWTAINRNTTLSGLSWGNGEFLYLRWTGDDVSGAGSRDEFALDDITLTAVPEPEQWGLISAICLLAFAGLHSWRSRRQLALIPASKR